MIDLPAPGEVVHVYPDPALLAKGGRVRVAAGLNRFLPKEGQKLPWSEHLLEQLRQGTIHLSDPKAQCKPEEARALAEAEAKKNPPAPAAEPVKE